MISTNNKPKDAQPADADFTECAYRQLVRDAITAYPQATYRDIPWGRRFILWRHDCDFSLNRALALAKIESQEKLRSTFFVNPHSEFYNLFERAQCDLIKAILELGHDIGLHFDAEFHAACNETELDELVSAEADRLEELLRLRPAVFSFHNPSALHLTCEAEHYGGLVNCYSRRFKSEVSYCSDSNGYWRFRRLADVLAEPTDDCLQVLTHPGWWQSVAMPPRQRVYRAVWGRAAATLTRYDEVLDDAGRENLAGASGAISVLKEVDSDLYELCDYLWNTNRFEALFVELCRAHAAQVHRMCVAVCRTRWGVSEGEFDAIVDETGPSVDSLSLLELIFDYQLQPAIEVFKEEYSKWMMLRSQLIRGRLRAERSQLENGCTYFCRLIQAVSDWGLRQRFSHAGAWVEPTGASSAQSEPESLRGPDTPRCTASEWNDLKTKIGKVNGHTA